MVSSISCLSSCKGGDGTAIHVKLTESREVAIADKSLQMDITTRTQVGSSNPKHMIAKKKNTVRMRLDAIPATTAQKLKQLPHPSCSHLQMTKHLNPKDTSSAAAAVGDRTNSKNLTVDDVALQASEDLSAPCDCSNNGGDPILNRH